MGNIQKNNFLTTLEVVTLLNDNNIKIKYNQGIIRWFKKGIFPKPVGEKTSKYLNATYIFDKDMVELWIKCYKKIIGAHDLKKRSDKRMKKVFDIYKFILGKKGSTMAPDLLYNEEAIKDVEAKTNKAEAEVTGFDKVIDAVKAADAKAKAERKLHEQPSVNQIPVNEMRVIHTQFTNGEVEYLSDIHEEVDNILDYVQNFIIINIPDVNTEITDSDSLLKLYKDVFIMANTIDFILKSLREATNKMEKCNARIHEIIDNFLKRISGNME